MPPAAVRVWLYTLPTLPSARAAVVTLTPPNTVMASALLAVAPLASVACTVKLLVPEVVGTPLISPVDPFRLKPAGSVPERMPHVGSGNFMGGVDTNLKRKNKKHPGDITFNGSQAIPPPGPDSGADIIKDWDPGLMKMFSQSNVKIR